MVALSMTVYLNSVLNLVLFFFFNMIPALENALKVHDTVIQYCGKQDLRGRESVLFYVLSALHKSSVTHLFTNINSSVLLCAY